MMQTRPPRLEAAASLSINRNSSRSIEANRKSRHESGLLLAHGARNLWLLFSAQQKRDTRITHIFKF